MKKNPQKSISKFLLIFFVFFSIKVRCISGLRCKSEILLIIPVTRQILEISTNLGSSQLYCYKTHSDSYQHSGILLNVLVQYTLGEILTVDVCDFVRIMNLKMNIFLLQRFMSSCLCLNSEDRQVGVPYIDVVIKVLKYNVLKVIFII